MTSYVKNILVIRIKITKTGEKYTHNDYDVISDQGE